MRKFGTKNGDCYEISLPKSMDIPGEQCSPVEKGTVTCDRVAVGAMKGLGMALANAGVDELIPGDIIVLTCTGSMPSPAGHETDLVTFSIIVHRE